MRKAYNSHSELPSFCNNATLRFLSFGFILGRNTAPVLSRLSLLVPASLEVLRVRLQDDPFADIQTKAVWGGVDTALNDPKFSKLQRFEIVDYKSPAITGTDAPLPELLPKSYRRGLLWFRLWTSRSCTWIIKHRYIS